MLRAIQEKVEAMAKEVAAVGGRQATMAQVLDALRKQPDTRKVLRVDTNLASVTRFLMLKDLGCPAVGLTVVDVGGGNLEVSIDGDEFIAVAKGDTFEEKFTRLEVRTSTQAVGTAKLRVVGYLGGR